MGVFVKVLNGRYTFDIKFILDFFHIRPYGIVGYAPVHNIYEFGDCRFNGFCKILNLDVSQEQLMNEAQLQLIPCCKKTVPFEDLQIIVHEEAVFLR